MSVNENVGHRNGSSSPQDGAPPAQGQSLLANQRYATITDVSPVLSPTNQVLSHNITFVPRIGTPGWGNAVMNVGLYHDYHNADNGTQVVIAIVNGDIN